jgi:hypothetical protein
LYADEELATVTVVTGFCGYLVPDHRLGMTITGLRDLDHLTGFFGDLNYR